MSGALIVAGLVMVWAGGYAISCWWWPLGHCWCCKGTGRHYRKDGKVFRPCRWCRGSGRRWRIGRRVWSFFQGRVKG